LSEEALSQELQAMIATPDAESDAVQRLITALARTEAFPAEGGAVMGVPIPIIQTHASVVLLTSTHAYKIKKPVNLGFLDYSTVQRRRQLCIEECTINKTLARSVYLGVAPVLRRLDGSLIFGATYAAEQAPQAGQQIQGGEVSDFAVVMRRLPEAQTLATLVDTGRADDGLLRRVARFIADFHQQAPVIEPGEVTTTVDATLANILLTLRQAGDHVSHTVTKDDYERIQRYIMDFSRVRRPLLESRARDGCYRDGHGDLRLEHIYDFEIVVDEQSEERHELVIVDRIEFDPHYRVGDVASDIAFLVVELERVGRGDLARVFADEYIQYTGNVGVREVLPFYAVYRALVRGHVRSLLLTEPGVDEASRATIQSEAHEMFVIAARYACSPTEPQLIMIGGLIGSGKTTLAAILNQDTGAPVIASDQIRKRLAGLSLNAVPTAEEQRRIYSAAWNQRVYRQLVTEARALLTQSHSVILDATFARREWRHAGEQLARDVGAQAIFLECVLPQETALERLAARWRAKHGQQGQQGQSDTMAAESGVAATLASDGRPELYDQLRQNWEAFEDATEGGLRRAMIDMSQESIDIRAQALATLGLITV
jgi:aminoglycoside phosphotransferase family enzyme/predicted kinase